MSADNWAICPRCALTDKDPAYEFREDYELGVLRDGEFYISYRGQCVSCGLQKQYKYSEQLDLSPAKPVPHG